MKSLIDAVKAGRLDEVVSIFGRDGKDLVDSTDPALARRNREVFIAAVGERWKLVDEPGDRKRLVIGNEDWPFPVPLARTADGWRFDTTSGKEEVIERRIGRNELSAIRLCRTYVAAQQLYGAVGHDGRPPGVFATKFRSDAGTQNGLYWPASRGQKRSPLGDLVADAAAEGRPIGEGPQPSPFHGYYFRILTAQGPSAAGGAKDYVADGAMTGGFALVAWPALYGASGIMTFVVNQGNIVYEKDFGADTDARARAMKLFDPDPTWSRVE